NAEATRQSDEAIYQTATDLLFDVRKQRSEAKQPLKVPISKVRIKDAAGSISYLPMVEADLRSALRVKAFEAEIGEPREVGGVGWEWGEQAGRAGVRPTAARLKPRAPKDTDRWSAKASAERHVATRTAGARRL